MKNKILSLTALILVAALLLPFSVEAIGTNGLVKEMKKGQTTLFQIDSKTASATLQRIGTDSDGKQYAVMEVNSRFLETGLTSRIYTGESKQFDTNLDGINDLDIMLESTVFEAKASLIFREIALSLIVLAPSAKEEFMEKEAAVEKEAMVKEEPQPEAIEPSPLQPVTGSAVADTGSSAKTISWVVVGVIVLIALVIFATRKRQQ